MSAHMRLSEQSHQTLKEMASALGESMQCVLDKAVEAYRRKAFLDQVNREFAALRADPRAWAEESEERRIWGATLADGLEQ